MNVILPNGVTMTDIPDDATDWEIQQDAIRQGVAKKEDFPPVDFDFWKMAGNIPGSALQYAKDMTFPLRHPIQTAIGLQTVAQGGVEKLLPKPAQPEGDDWGQTQNEQAVDMVGQFISDRYGSVDALKNTLMNDPVGSLSDVSGVGTLATFARKSGGVMDKINKASKAIDPLNATANAVRLPAGLMVPKDLPIKQMNSAIKWNTNTPMKLRNTLARTMLEEGISPTLKGMEKAQEVISRLNDEITSLIKEVGETGVTVPREKVFKYIKDARKKAAEGGNPVAELRQIDKFVDDLEATWYNYEMSDFTPAQLQKFKQSLYSLVDYDKKNQASAVGTDAARMQTARSARELIQDMVPEVGALNKREGELLNLTNKLEQKASRIENTNNFPLSMGTHTGAGYLLGENLGFPGLGTGLGLGIAAMDLPKNKAAIAQMLHNMQNASILDAPIPGQLTRQSAIQSGRLIPEL
jgi:hypothetical protein